MHFLQTLFSFTFFFIFSIKYTCFHSYSHHRTRKEKEEKHQNKNKKISICSEINRSKLLKIRREIMEGGVAYENDLNLKATELRLGLPGSERNEEQAVSCSRNNKRPLQETKEEIGSIAKGKSDASLDDSDSAPSPKSQIIGWPPIRSYRKNSLQTKKNEAESCGIYVKVSMAGAPYLRKIDLKVYKGYTELLMALENMFKFKIGEYSEREGYKGSEFAPTYEDKDSDWMLVGDVPWEMFMSSCKRLRIMKASEARGLGCGGV